MAFWSLLHALHIVGEADGLAGLGHAGLKAQQLGDGVAVRVIGGDAFFEEAAEVFVELVVLLRVIGGFFVEVLEQALATTSPILRTRALSCMLSREMFSGRSSLSITPRTKRIHSGSSFFGFGSMRTFLQ
jgi:hypothetical protein